MTWTRRRFVRQHESISHQPTERQESAFVPHEHWSCVLRRKHQHPDKRYSPPCSQETQKSLGADGPCLSLASASQSDPPASVSRAERLTSLARYNDALADLMTTDFDTIARRVIDLADRPLRERVDRLRKRCPWMLSQICQASVRTGPLCQPASAATNFPQLQTYRKETGSLELRASLVPGWRSRLIQTAVMKPSSVSRQRFQPSQKSALRPTRYRSALNAGYTVFDKPTWQLIITQLTSSVTVATIFTEDSIPLAEIDCLQYEVKC